MNYKLLLATLNTKRARLDRAIAAIQALDEESLSPVSSDPDIRRRGRPLGSRNKPKVSTTDLPVNSDGNQSEGHSDVNREFRGSHDEFADKVN